MSIKHHAPPARKPTLLQRIHSLKDQVRPRKAFLAVFFASFLFLVASHLLEPCLENRIYFGISLIVPFIITYLILGRNPALIFAGTSISYLIFTGVGGIPTLYLHIVFLSLAMYFLWDERGKLISGCCCPYKRIGLGVVVFMLMLLAVGIVNVIVQSTVFSGERVTDLIPDLPLYLLIMSFTLGPVSEELFFRAVLVPRAGVAGSSILFAVTHAIYGSVTEIGGAFVLGLVLAFAYRHLNDPLPCIIAHMLFNLVSVSMILWTQGFFTYY